MILPNYLIQNSDRIKSLPEQNIALWNKNYDYFLDDYSIVQDIYKLFPDRDPQRKDVTRLFEKDYFIGFIAAMMWGGIKPIHFNLLLKYTVNNLKKLDQSIQYAEKQIKKSNFKELFMAFDSGANKIPGIGPSYFTKLFFYLGEINDIKIKPLIFDKWTSNAHCALSIQQLSSYPERIFYYTGINTNEKHMLNYRNREDLYVQYVNDLNNWANELDVPASKLEQFLFGISLKTNKDKTNPRLELWSINKNHFPHFLIKKSNNISLEKPKLVNSGISELSPDNTYFPLQLVLKKSAINKVDKVRLTINEIEKIIMRPLPPWAFSHIKIFWGNSGSQYHVQKSAWLSQGYKVDLSSITQERSKIITFIKD
ncbi:hypothetical protein GCM10028807_34410 [Spirosoma daeguense]